MNLDIVEKGIDLIDSLHPFGQLPECISQKEAQKIIKISQSINQIIKNRDYFELNNIEVLNIIKSALVASYMLGKINNKN